MAQHRPLPDVGHKAEEIDLMAGIPLTLAEIDERIAAARENLRELVEQAAAYSGAGDEDLASKRIAAQEARLAQLIRERDLLAKSKP
jgi:hypothetical protein